MQMSLDRKPAGAHCCPGLLLPRARPPEALLPRARPPEALLPEALLPEVLCCRGLSARVPGREGRALGAATRGLALDRGEDPVADREQGRQQRLVLT